MHRIPTSDHNRLIFRKGSFLNTAIALGTLALAPILLHLAMMLLDWSRAGEGYGILGGFLTLAAFGCGLGGALGLLKSFGRSGLVFDWEQGTLQVWHGVLFPWWSHTYRLQFEQARIDELVIKERRSYRFLYPVTLIGQKQDVCLDKGENFMHARSLADQVARFLTIDVLDSTGDEPVLRPASSLGKPLRATVAAEQLDRAVAEAPAGTRLRAAVDGDQIVFDIPRPTLRSTFLFPVAMFIIGAIIASPFVLLALLFGEANWSDRLACLCALPVFGGILFLIGCLFTLPGMFVATRIEAGPEELHVRRRGLILGRRWVIRAEELEELRIESRFLVAMSRNQRVAIGAGEDLLSREELEWLRDVITRVVTAS
jgi:hypothetical protein